MISQDKENSNKDQRTAEDPNRKGKDPPKYISSLYTNTLKSNRDDQSFEGNSSLQSNVELNRILFKNIMNNIKGDYEQEDAKEDKVNWIFSVFNLQRRVYYLYESIDKESFVIPFDGECEIFIV